MVLTSSLIVAATVGVVAGALIGCIGVGGVIIVPALIQLPDVDVSLAVPACLFSYIFGGVAGVAAYWCKGKIDWQEASVFCVASAPAALLGAWLFHQISEFAIKITMYTLTLITSIFSLFRTWKEYRSTSKLANKSPEVEQDATTHIQALDTTPVDRPDDEPTEHPLTAHSGIQTSTEQIALIIIEEADDKQTWFTKRSPCFRVVLRSLIGFAVGLGSALTGTSGPVILLPILICLQWDIKLALGSCQAVQVPIAVASTLGNVFFGKEDVDFVLGSCIAAGLAPTVILGAHIVNKIPAKPLKIGVSVILIIASLGLLIWELTKT